jgi:gluconolactonase
MQDRLTRRCFVAGATALVSAPAWAPARAQDAKPALGAPATVISNPPRMWGDGAPPNIFPDPDMLVIDPAFNRLRMSQAVIKRLATGFQWAEGPAWSNEGQYVLFSDVKGDVQYRYIWETGTVTPFRRPSFNSNGNCFDFQGRQVSCQHYLRRIVRWEHDGTLTVIADTYQGKALNSPDDVAVHKDGSIWFTDPRFGGSLSEGHADTPGTGANADGRDDPAIGEGGLGLNSRAIRIGDLKQELPANTYRWDPSGRLDVVVDGSAPGGGPNGIAFSPDYKIVYTMKGGTIIASDIQGTKIANSRALTDCMVDGVACRPDGFRVDRGGNLWIGSTAPLGYAGVTVWSAAGKLLGRIRLPETCANMCFAGPKRDYLFMTAAQSIYMVRVGIQGASPG